MSFRAQRGIPGVPVEGPSTRRARIPHAPAFGGYPARNDSYCTTFGCTTGSEMNDACVGERKIFCVVTRKSEFFASKMFGTNVCGLRSMSGNHELCTCTMIRCPFLKR